MQAHVTACWAAICFGRRFSLLPCQPGIDWHGGVSWNTNASSSSLSLFPAPLWWLLYLKDMPSALAHSCIFLEIKLTWANVPGAIHGGQLPTQHSVMTSLCGATRLYSSLDLYHGHIMHTHRHTYTRACRHTTLACTFSKPDFPVGWSVIGRLFKGKVWAKKILAVRLPW